MSKVKIGIIGGSGLNNPDILEKAHEKSVVTPFGSPSDVLIEGEIKGVPCVLLARHGRKHTIYPSGVNYRANVWAMKEAGCTHLLASTACGGLQEHTHPGDIVILDQFIDRTQGRKQTFYDGVDGHPCQGVLHIPMAEPFCAKTRKLLHESALKVVKSGTVHAQGCVLTIEGPRFSSRQESRYWHSIGADVINMTTVPEVVLAKEAGLCYAAVAMVTDHDSWKADGNSVSVSSVLEIFKANVDKVKHIFLDAIPKIAAIDWTDDVAHNQRVILNSRQDLMTHGSQDGK